MSQKYNITKIYFEIYFHYVLLRRTFYFNKNVIKKNKDALTFISLLMAIQCILIILSVDFVNIKKS